MTSGNRGGRHRMGGPRRIEPRTSVDVPAQTPTAAPVPQKKRVLFVCIGNSCRSQMAEAFARAYGSDIMEVMSAGVSPAMMIAPMTKQVLSERNLKIDDQFPKGIDLMSSESFDVIVNMSGQRLLVDPKLVREWMVEDPIGQKESVYKSVAEKIEGLVMRLILELRSAQ